MLNSFTAHSPFLATAGTAIQAIFLGYAGSFLTFLTTTSWGQYQSLGSATLGNNPMVVTIPFGVSSLAGGNVSVFAGTPNGPSNLIGQFTSPISTPP